MIKRMNIIHKQANGTFFKDATQKKLMDMPMGELLDLYDGSILTKAMLMDRAELLDLKDQTEVMIKRRKDATNNLDN